MEKRKRILVTGLRVPASLEIIRCLAQAGHTVFGADSMRFPFYKGARHVEKTFYLPPPAYDLPAYEQELVRLIDRLDLDLLIPTSEDIFYISHLKPMLTEHCDVFCDSFDKLSRLHHKYACLDMAEGLGINIPETHLFDAESMIETVVSQKEKWIFKPAYTRFAEKLVVKPTRDEFADIDFGSMPWLAQQFIDGQEVCSFSLAHDGRVVAHSCYEPKYRIGRGAGIYFVPTRSQRIERFVTEFVAKHHFTGQIGFDFIESANQIFLIECNPRTTSGVHLLMPATELAKAYVGGETLRLLEQSTEPKMIASAALLTGLLPRWRRQSIRTYVSDYFSARDDVGLLGEYGMWPFQLMGGLEVLYKSFRFNLSLRDAVAADTEWNGNKIG